MCIGGVAVGWTGGSEIFEFVKIVVIVVVDFDDPMVHGFMEWQWFFWWRWIALEQGFRMVVFLAFLDAYWRCGTLSNGWQWMYFFLKKLQDIFRLLSIKKYTSNTCPSTIESGIIRKPQTRAFQRSHSQPRPTNTDRAAADQTPTLRQKKKKKKKKKRGGCKKCGNGVRTRD
jgi:hypothetical protein